VRYKIEKVFAREILDSRGNPTVEVDVATYCSDTSSRGFGRASVPSGASTGTNEALELRDKDNRYYGKGVRTAIHNINTNLGLEISGMDVCHQREIDQIMIELDGTDNKSNLGANAILGVSMAVARAAADSLGLPLYKYLGGCNSFTLPVPTLNIINGGQHAGNELAIQEFMIQPKGADSFREAVRWAAETYHTLGDILKEKYGASATNVGYEGGYAPPINRTTDAMEAITDAIELAGYTEYDITIGIDAAASSFFNNGRYDIDGEQLTAGELMDLYLDLVRTYPIIYVEDPFEEEAFEDFAALTMEIPDTLIVGDDLFATNVERIKQGIEMDACNALLMKVNQIGSISEAFDAATTAQQSGYSVVVSHRSAETEDNIIADISVALGADLIKTGAPARSERTGKYNQLMRIEEELGIASHYMRI
jgi:enolase